MKDYTMEFCVGSLSLQALGFATGVTELNMKAILAGCIVGIGLSAMSNIEPRISTGLAGIMFFTLAANTLPQIMEKIGLTSAGLKDMDSSASADASEDARLLADPDKTQLNRGLKDSEAKPNPEANPQFTPEKESSVGKTKSNPQQDRNMLRNGLT